MRRALTLLLIATPAAAAPHGPGCQLSTADCLTLGQEMAAEQVLQAEDQRSFALTMPAGPRAELLIRRHFIRKTARYAHLPVRIREEWARVEACSAEDEAARLNGTTNPDPDCR